MYIDKMYGTLPNVYKNKSPYKYKGPYIMRLNRVVTLLMRFSTLSTSFYISKAKNKAPELTGTEFCYTNLSISIAFFLALSIYHL